MSVDPLVIQACVDELLRRGMTKVDTTTDPESIEFDGECGHRVSVLFDNPVSVYCEQLCTTSFQPGPLQTLAADLQRIVDKNAGADATGNGNKSQHLITDANEIRRVLELLCQAGEVHELRALETRRGKIVSGYYNDLNAFANDAARCSSDLLAAGTYVTINPCQPEILNRAINRLREFVSKDTTADSNIIQRRWLPLDFDPIRAGKITGISSTTDEHATALAKAREVRLALRALNWPEPLLIDSGNGADLLYRIDLPNEPKSTELLRKTLETAALLYADPQVDIDLTMFNAARIIRLAGTINRKGDNTPKRPWRAASIVEAPHKLEIVTREALERMAAMAAKPERTSHSQSNQSSGLRFELGTFIQQHGIAVKREKPYQGGTAFILEHCLFDSTHGGTSAAIFQLAGGALVYKCQHQSCLDKRWQHVREKYEPGYRERRENYQLVREFTMPPDQIRVARIEQSMMTAAEVLREHRAHTARPQLASGLLIAGTFNMLAGRPYAGKSTFAAALTRALHLGRPFLGRQCSKTKVGYFCLERSGVGVAKLFEKWGLADEILYQTEIKQENAVAYIEEQIWKFKLQFVVIDHLQHAVRLPKGNDYAGVSNALAPFQRLAAETGCCVLALHHQRKPTAEERAAKVDLENDGIDVLGSEAYRAASETILECTRAANKGGAGINEIDQMLLDRGHNLDLPEQPPAEASTTRYRYFVRGETRDLTDLARSRIVIDLQTGEVATGDAHQEEVDAVAVAVTRFLVANGPATEKEIRANVRGMNVALSDALRKTGQFERDGQGGARDPYVYRLPDQPSRARGDSEKAAPKGQKILQFQRVSSALKVADKTKATGGNADNTDSPDNVRDALSLPSKSRATQTPINTEGFPANTRLVRGIYEDPPGRPNREKDDRSLPEGQHGQEWQRGQEGQDWQDGQDGQDWQDGQDGQDGQLGQEEPSEGADDDDGEVI